MCLPGCGLLSTRAATVVAVQGSVDFTPSVAMGLSQVPAPGVISGCRMEDFIIGVLFLSCPVRETAAYAAMARVRILNLNLCLRFERLSQCPSALPPSFGQPDPLPLLARRRRRRLQRKHQVLQVAVYEHFAGRAFR